MKEFKFLRRNTWYNPNQQIAVCGSTISNTAVLVTDDVIFSTEAITELVAASRQLQERINILQRETMTLRNDLNRRLEEF